MQSQSSYARSAEGATTLPSLPGTFAKATGFTRACLDKGWRLWDVAQFSRGKKHPGVLLVESDWVSRLILQHKLQNAGLRVHPCVDIRDALRVIRRRALDGVLLETSSGSAEFVAELRQDPTFAGRPIFELSCFEEASSSDSGSDPSWQHLSKLSCPADAIISRFLAAMPPGPAGGNAACPLPLGEAETVAFGNVTGLIQEAIAELCHAWDAVVTADDDTKRTSFWLLLRQRAHAVVSCTALSGKVIACALAKDLVHTTAACDPRDWPLPEPHSTRISEAVRQLRQLDSTLANQPAPDAGPERSKDSLELSDPVPLRPDANPPVQTGPCPMSSAHPTSISAVPELVPTPPDPAPDSPAASPTERNGDATPAQADAPVMAPPPIRPENERRLRESISTLARVTTNLEKERVERRRSDERAAALAAQLQSLHRQLGQDLESEKDLQKRIAELESRAQRAEELAVRTREELHREKAARLLAEEELGALTDINAQWEVNQGLLNEAKTAFERMRTETEQRLNATISNLQATEEKLRKEMSERQRLEDAVVLLEKQRREQEDQAQVEIVGLKSTRDLECLERRRLNEEILRVRCLAMDSRRGNSAMVERLRAQLLGPVKELQEAICHLLQNGLPESQHCVVQHALENVLLLQTGLQEPEASRTEPATPVDSAQFCPENPAPPVLSSR